MGTPLILEDIAVCTVEYLSACCHQLSDAHASLLLFRFIHQKATISLSNWTVFVASQLTSKEEEKKKKKKCWRSAWFVLRCHGSTERIASFRRNICSSIMNGNKKAINMINFSDHNTWKIYRWLPIVGGQAFMLYWIDSRGVMLLITCLSAAQPREPCDITFLGSVTGRDYLTGCSYCSRCFSEATIQECILSDFVIIHWNIALL